MHGAQRVPGRTSAASPAPRMGEAKFLPPGAAPGSMLAPSWDRLWAAGGFRAATPRGLLPHAGC